MCICTGMRSTKALARNAPGNATIPIRNAKAITCAFIIQDTPNTEIYTIPMTIDMAASVAMTPAPSTPVAINNDNKITPEPAVPPTTTP